jgi:hypothetical protein
MPVSSVRCPNPNCNTSRDGNTVLQPDEQEAGHRPAMEAPTSAANDAGVRAADIPAGEIARHLHLLLDDMRWFHYAGININFEPTPDGWSLKLSLRVIFVRDGSLLDEAGLAVIAEMAKAHDYQVWIEDARSEDPAALVIEDDQLLIEHAKV